MDAILSVHKDITRHKIISCASVAPSVAGHLAGSICSRYSPPHICWPSRTSHNLSTFVSLVRLGLVVFYYRPGPATERLVYQGRIKGILRQEVEANSPAMWRPLSDEVAKLHCLHILLVDKRVCLANNESSRSRNAKGFRDTYIESVAPYLLCVWWRWKGCKGWSGWSRGVRGVWQTATNIRFRCRQNVLPLVMPKCFGGAGSRTKFLNAKATSTNNLFCPQ